VLNHKPNNLPKVVTQRCLEQDLNPRPTDRKPKCLTVAPPRHPATAQLYEKSHLTRIALSCGIKISPVGSLN